MQGPGLGRRGGTMNRPRAAAAAVPSAVMQQGVSKAGMSFAFWLAFIMLALVIVILILQSS